MSFFTVILFQNLLHAYPGLPVWTIVLCYAHDVHVYNIISILGVRLLKEEKLITLKTISLQDLCYNPLANPNVDNISWEPEGHYYYSTMFPLTTRRGLLLYKFFRNTALLVLNRTSLSSVNPFRTKTPNIYSQEEINLYCIIKLAT